MGPMEISPGQARSDERRPGTLILTCIFPQLDGEHHMEKVALPY